MKLHFVILMVIFFLSTQFVSECFCLIIPLMWVKVVVNVNVSLASFFCSFHLISHFGTVIIVHVQ